MSMMYDRRMTNAKSSQWPGEITMKLI